MAAGIFFLFILLLIIAAWTDLKEGYIPDSVSILIFLLSFYSLFIRSGPGLLLRIEGAVLCGGLLEGIRLISRGGIGMGDVKLMTACGFFLGITPERSPLFLPIYWQVCSVCPFSFLRKPP